MPATRRTSGGIPARKTRRAEACATAQPSVSAPAGATSDASIEPVSADPAVVLWDEVAPPDAAAAGEATRDPAAKTDKALS